MAIDSRNKRSSVQAYLLGLVRPLADGAVGAADRATVAWLYAGLTYSAPAEAVSGSVNPMLVTSSRMMRR